MNKMKYKINCYKKNIFEINYQKLKEKGIKLIVFDLDNTLGLVKDKIIPLKSRDLIKKLSKDFKVVVASNNSKRRVSMFVDGCCDYIYFSLKPSKKFVRIIDKRYHMEKSECAIIGDQIVTDILVGSKVGYYTILVDPIGEDGKATSLNRYLEKKVKEKIQFKDGEYFEEN